MPDDLVGQTLGPYEISEFVGYERTAEVYKGYYHEADKPIVVRFVGRGLEADPVWSARFRREGRAIAALRHANIAPAYDFGEALDGHYMVSEYLEGNTLADLLAQVKAGERSLLPDDITFMIRQVAAALDHAHAQGVIHRDLNPNHIIITRSGQAIIADFGLAMLLSRGAEEHIGGAYFGAADYMAPEILADFLAATPASDIYSLGVILYQITTGELPYHADSDVDEALRSLTDSAPDPRLLNAEIPYTVAQTILQALSRSPKERFKNAMQLASQLEWAYANPQPPEPEPKARRRKPSKESPKSAIPPEASMPVSSRPVAERLVVKRGLSWQDERREKARLRAEHRRIQREEQARQRRIQREENKQKRRARQQSRRERWRAFWARWGRTVAVVTILLVVAAGITYGLGAAGVISVAVKVPELPTLPSRPSPTLIPPTGTPFDANAVLQSIPPTPTPALTPTPLQPTGTPIPPLQFTPLGVDTTAFRVHDGAAMQFVPAGQFLMGTNDPNRNPNARPQHPVMLSDYWIDRTEVTNAQYALCVEGGPCQPPSQRIYFDDPAYADYPVTFVTYSQAVSYCLWQAGQSGQVIGLPTEAQWEKAAAWDPATGVPRLYPWGNEQPTHQRGRFYGGPEGRPASPVGSHPAGVSAYGVQDMAGNVWEWVSDWFDPAYYKRTGVAVDPTGPLTGVDRVTRGGSWRNEGYLAVSTARNPARPSVNGDSLGFRCAMTASRPPVDSGIVLTPLDAARTLATLIQQSQSDTQNDSGTLAEWLTALSDLDTALASGDNTQAIQIITERVDRLAAQRDTGLLTADLAFRLDRGLTWIQEQLTPVPEG